ncbi:MAG: hypothetical protein FWE80_01225 [Oscillospiraceae bacterium]|nr:hypothetical protein [Oscillospiraceae bacterium]
MGMNKKLVITAVLLLAFLVLLFPIPFENFENGESNGMFKAIAYTVYRYNYKSSTGPDGKDGYIQGTQVFIFGKKIYDNTIFTASN